MFAPFFRSFVWILVAAPALAALATLATLPRFRRGVTRSVAILAPMLAVAVPGLRWVDPWDPWDPRVVTMSCFDTRRHGHGHPGYVWMIWVNLGGTPMMSEDFGKLQMNEMIAI